MRPHHRHSLGHEHEFEPVYGLPEVPPPEERILWQGTPDWRALALRAFHVRKLAIYFALMLALRAAGALGDGGSLAAAARAVVQLLPLALLGVALPAVLAWLSARTTAYTLTNRRVVMRIGIVLTLTFNIPLRRIAAADLAEAPRGSGDIALALAGRERIGWMQLWPHARPWRFATPQPMLRCVPQGAEVARLLAQTWSAATGQQAQAAATIDSLPATRGAALAGPALAAR